MRRHCCSLVIATTTFGLLLSGGCRSPSPERSDDPPPWAAPAPDDVPGVRSGRTRGMRIEDVPLEDLGLVYDDTIVTTSARTVDFNGQALIPRSIRVKKSGGGRDLAVDVNMLKVVFGLDPDFTLSVAVPHVSKRLQQPGGAPTLRAKGYGDTLTVGKYRFYQDTGPGETTEAALLVGVKLPTGRDRVTDNGMRLPQPLQPGSGSVDGVLGGAFTRIKGRWLLNADLIAKLNTEANDYRFGNSLRFDIGGHYRAYPARYERFDQMTVNLVAELNSSWSEKDKDDGSRVSASGGTKAFFTPGMQVIISENLLFEGAYQIPVHMNLRGSQLEEDSVAIVGLRLRF